MYLSLSLLDKKLFRNKFSSSYINNVWQHWISDLPHHILFKHFNSDIFIKPLSFPSIPFFTQPDSLSQPTNILTYKTSNHNIIGNLNLLSMVDQKLYKSGKQIYDNHKTLNYNQLKSMADVWNINLVKFYNDNNRLRVSSFVFTLQLYTLIDNINNVLRKSLEKFI